MLPSKINEEWQRRACQLRGIWFVCPFRWWTTCDFNKTRFTFLKVHTVGGERNCMFRSVSYVISGSEEQHFEIWLAIVAHILTIPHLVSGIGPDGNRNYLVTYNGGYRSVEDYLVRSRMAEDGTWGSDFELSVLAHLLNTPVYSFQGGDDCLFPTWDRPKNPRAH